MAYLYITYKDYENGPAGHLGLSWRSGRHKRTFTADNQGKALARAKVSQIESAGKRWGRVAIVNRATDTTTQTK